MSVIVCVGGPYAGRRIELPRECRILKFPEWPKLSRVLRTVVGNATHDMDNEVVCHEYRWHRSVLDAMGCRIEVVAMVHESMRVESEINVAVLGMVLAGIIERGLNPAKAVANG